MMPSQILHETVPVTHWLLSCSHAVMTCCNGMYMLLLAVCIEQNILSSLSLSGVHIFPEEWAVGILQVCTAL